MAGSPNRAVVYFRGNKAGILSREEREWVVFAYDQTYLARGGPALSLSLPLRGQPFRSRDLPAYFSGLCSEGWLRRVQSFEQGIHPDDHFTRLVLNGRDLAGAVTIIPEMDDHIER